jgi:heme/copper-type cytochrome/quinol oxidase subunit 2
MVSRDHAIELLGVIITSVVLGYIGVIAGANLIAIDNPPDAPSNSVAVKVIARQFFWTFQYAPNSSITFPNGTTRSFPNGTSFENTLYVKVGQIVILQIVSLDVDHSFFIPDLGIHIDAIPGHDNHYWFTADTPGQYIIECTQFCGTGHYTMIGQLVVTA